jgi:glycosyltransferase involved in cell wall biosynthesis
MTSKPIRVALVAQAAPARGGIPSFVASLLSAPALKDGFALRLVNTTRVSEREAGTFTASNIGHAIQDTFRVAKAARNADIVHVQTALLPVLPLLRAIALCAAGKLGRAKVICHVHSGRLNSGQPEAFTPSRLYRALLRVLSKTADRVIVVADPGKRLLESEVPGISVRTIHNAVDTAAFQQASPEVDPPQLAYVGTLSNRKGLADLIDALELVPPFGPVVVAGGSHEVGEAEAEALRLRATQSTHDIRLVGSLDSTGVKALLSQSQVFVLPSHWEGQPIAILEAMATGLPVVVSSVGDNPDVERYLVEVGMVSPNNREE